ncbi:MAG: DUF3800 domain-containing protein [Myxococcales bacterium]|nr:DUF3800 domain-containing protein [Myxococcales bacterium]MCB9650283.1 DUF3800 domain-containing protein [Deltaproteobacteria bacterium]
MSSRRDHLVFDEDRDPDDPQPTTAIPGYRSYYIYCDETCIQGGSAHFGWGSLWIPSNRTGDIGGSDSETGLAGLKRLHSFDHELKWSRINSQNLPFFLDVVDWFFHRKWMMFHGLIVRSEDVDWARYEHRAAGRVFFLSELLRWKLAEYNVPGEDRLFRIRVDPLPIDYRKEHEKIERINNAMLRQRIGRMPIKSIKTISDSKRSAGVQICDLLLGAWVWAWNDPDTTTRRGGARKKVADRIAAWLGWKDLRGATFRQAWKFNGWYFKPKEQGRRRVHARQIPEAFENIEKWRKKPEQANSSK